MLELDPLTVSLCYFAFFLIPGALLRYLIGKLASARYAPYLQDFIATGTQLACAAEYGHFWRLYGKLGFFFCIFMVGRFHYFVRTRIARGMTNPCSYLERVLRREQDWTVFFSLTLLVAQFLGAVCGQCTANYIRGYGLTAYHTSRYSENYFTDYQCNSQLHTSAQIGFLVEGCCYAFADLLATREAITILENKDADATIKGFINCFLCLQLVHLTGYFLNPTISTVAVFRCAGSTLAENIIVYWCGPVSAAVIIHVVKQQLGDE